MSKEINISCPNCGHEFNVESVLTNKIESHLKAQIQTQFKEKFEQENQKREQEAKIALEQKIEEERKRLQTEATESVEKKMKFYQEENEKKTKELQELKHREVEFMKKEQALKNKEEELELALQKKILEQQEEIERKVRTKEREKFELKEKELEKKFEDQNKLIDEMKRKAEQGSMQLQGEVQELALEDLLSRLYPFDRIEEVAKGVRGADCIQTIINSSQQECGKIIYESKRTQTFSKGWIDKLKTDMVNSKGDIAVLVTETMPKGETQFLEMDGVWICQFSEVKSLSLILREMLLRMSAIKKSQENKGDKLELLYDYLTSADFVQKVKMCIENYDKMKHQLESEKKAMTKIWAEREKQLGVSQESLITIFGAINGISDNLIKHGDFLALDHASS